jgi:hypothetical protein
MFVECAEKEANIIKNIIRILPIMLVIIDITLSFYRQVNCKEILFPSSSKFYHLLFNFIINP